MSRTVMIDGTPVEDVRPSVVDGTTKTFLQLFEVRSLDGGLVTSEIHDLTRFRRHSAIRLRSARLCVTLLLHKHVVDNTTSPPRHRPPT